MLGRGCVFRRVRPVGHPKEAWEQDLRAGRGLLRKVVTSRGEIVRPFRGVGGDGRCE